jgi:hypothetical protein
VLPLAGCGDPIPDMPAGRAWTEPERTMWTELWESPQATQYDDSYVPIVALYVRVVCDAITGRVTAGLAQEARHLADHLGLSPAGLKTLGWQMEQVDARTGEVHDAPVANIDARRARLTA